MNHRQSRAIEFLAEQYEYGEGSPHAHQVATLAGSLFDQLSKQGLLPGLTLSDRHTLVSAAYAHDIGFSPRAFEDTGGVPSWAPSDNSTDQHHAISFEILRAHLDNKMHSVSLPPFGHVDRSTLLYTVLWGSSGSNRTVNSEPLIDAGTSTLLGGMLRVADALDVRNRLMVQKVELRRSSAWIRLLIRAFDEAGAEVAAAQENAELLSSQLGLRVFVQEIIEPVKGNTAVYEGPFLLQPEVEEYLAALLAPTTLPRPD